MVQLRSWARSWPPRCHAGGEWSDPGDTKWHPKWHLTTTNFPKYKRRKHLQGATTSLILGATGVTPCGTQMAPRGTFVAPSGKEGLRPAPFWGAADRGLVRSGSASLARLRQVMQALGLQLHHGRLRVAGPQPKATGKS